MNAVEDQGVALHKYTQSAELASDQIIRAYSTSFGAATRLLGRRHRVHIRNIYALVRVTDELVDGVAAQAHLSATEQFRRLDLLERDTDEAIQSGYSTNPIVHAFAISAREAGIDASLTGPFFASMRMDLQRAFDENSPLAAGPDRATAIVGYDKAEHAKYVHGSAEVIGLMCLKVFIRGEHYTKQQHQRLERGASSLGAAFQNVNFLRDLADDTARLQRSYLAETSSLTEEAKDQWVVTIREQLAQAASVVPLLPADARLAVECASALFARLTQKVATTPVAGLLQQRVRVCNPAKALVIAQALFTRKGGWTR